MNIMRLHAFFLRCARPALTQRYTQDFYHSFKRESTALLEHMLPDVPQVGRGVFTFSYACGQGCIVWYKTFRLLGLTREESTENIWRMNERAAAAVPRWLLRCCGAGWLRRLRRLAGAPGEELSLQGWRGRLRALPGGVVEADITHCALRDLAHSFGADALFPAMCRMDYLYAERMGYGFVRTQTLADGDACCNCRYLPGQCCEWAPEKGFSERK